MGGAETWILEIIRNTHQSETDLPRFDFIAAGGEKGIFDDEVVGHGCRIYYLKLDKSNVVSFIGGLRRILAENNYVAIHDHQDFLSGWHFLFGAGLLPKVLISHLHNPYEQFLATYANSPRRRLNVRLGRGLTRWFATHIMGTSHRLMRQYGIVPERYPSQKVDALYCGFSLQRFAGSHEESKRSLCEELGWSHETSKIVLFAGRFDPRLELHHPLNHKNSAFALEVVHAVRDPSVRLVMAGINDGIRDEFMKLVERKGMRDRVRLLGVRKDIPRLMHASEVLLFPSRSEGMGLVAVEAQAAGLPVLASSEVPSEVAVMTEMVCFRSLQDPIEEWAKDLERLIQSRKPHDSTSDPRWETSGFNIEVSCKRLFDCYVNGRL